MPRGSQTPGRVVISNVAKDRIITRFQKPCCPVGPYSSKLDFHPKVKSACTENRVSKVGLKISKAVIVGDVAVGKTCLVNRFCHDTFDRDYKATIGVDFEVEKFSILSVPFSLQIWDTAGQERFKCIAASYYRGANVVIVVFDLGDIQSLENTRKWYDEANKSADDPLVFLVGTKKDLVSEATYKDVEDKALDMADQLKAEFWGVSSKTGENVQEFFFRLSSLMFDKAVLDEVETTTAGKQIGHLGTGSIKVDKNNENMYDKSKKSKCCQ
ncbi:ras-related protein Rab-34 [Lingula anatina]|uniref:Ras-related protein Rab-36 n=1 Tax=Lingula anatina TaxID=7574 RepID=A0A1S3HBP9_LINAN|nr:ras-related protein Rab-34-like [Lingula anatina]XP_013383447.1 ras-related protein Rab-34-like [Lingula anatina]XP_013415859.1 ras-related protein Rab-34 [Lingula anatina]|eukprot:XP_013383446.1 ras-related protein Rab-34-like [Lingula anatina]